MIGTSKAQQLFKGNFRQARRAASEGSIIWDRMGEDSEEWEFFLETLWELQCLKTYSELTEDVKKTFYSECQGITSVAVNLFILAQERALYDESNESFLLCDVAGNCSVYSLNNGLTENQQFSVNI